MITTTQLEDAYRNNYSALIAYAKRRGVADSEDIVHQAFIDLAQYKGDIQSIERFLYKSVMSDIINAGRKAERQMRHLEALAETTADWQSSSTAECDAETEESHVSIEKAFAGLSALEREAIQALFIDGLTYAEASSKLQKPIPSIQKNRNRAVRKLKAALA